MRAFEIIRIIEEFAPPAIQESWDNSGLSIGDLDSEVNSVLLALDCTPEIIEEAVSTGCQMIITHHPLIFKGIKQISNDTLLGSMITRIIRNNIIIYSAHTNADKVLSGVSGIMAARLGLVNIKFLNQDSGGEYGMGVIGDLETPSNFFQILKKVKKNFNPGVIKCSKPIDDKISRIALCGGSGSSLIENAREAGAQLFITGDVSYHFFFSEKGFMIMDIGHYESEYGLLELLKSVLTKKISTFAVRIAEKNTNPIHYY
ncbi:MAG: Nif3-like dinuclear metal center hexameric protein [Bacteroidales bacterium]|jgi:dinuclear metal center YbgI/SA1388 family protein